jgi:outer membrane protein OmpA-like peptidoglycan-associated protein
MKILIFGFLAFFGWSALSSHLYVCKIKGLCNEQVTMQTEVTNNKDTITGNALVKPYAPEPAASPGTLSVYFAFDKSGFSSDEMIEKYFEKSNTYLAQNSQARISITGYTDAIGSGEYNQALGYRRAQSMQNYFEGKGMPASKIIIESKGEKEPAENNNTSAGRANNRRTVITIKK